jgi:hypothetical protein
MRALLVWVLVLGAGVASAWAQGDPAGVPWSQLSPGEQQLLQRFSDNWDQLPPRKQQRLRNGALPHLRRTCVCRRSRASLESP